jgi:hypothetical protein
MKQFQASLKSTLSKCYLIIKNKMVTEVSDL